MVAHAIPHQHIGHNCLIDNNLMHTDDWVAFKLNYRQNTANAKAVSARFMTFFIGEMSC